MEESAESLIDTEENEHKTKHENEMKKEKNNFLQVSFVAEKTELEKLETYYDSYPLLNFRKQICWIR